MKKVLSIISLFTIFILLIALSACSSPGSTLAIELRIGGNANIAGGRTVDILQGEAVQFTPRLTQDGIAVTPAPTFTWELVGNTGSSVRSEVMATSSETGATVDNGLVTIPLEIPAAANSLRLNVTTTHGGQVVSTHAIINVVAFTPEIYVTPSPAAIPITTNTASFEASLPGVVMMGDFNWELRCADDGTLVPEALATVTASGLNNRSALVTILDRNSLRQTSGALYLNVTASGATAHSVLINLAMPWIQIGGSATPNPVTIETTTDTAIVVASLASGFTILGNFEWELVYAGSGEPVPASEATVTPSGNNASSAEVKIVDRDLLLRASGALRLNVTAPGVAPNHVLINVAMPLIQIGGSAEPDPVPIVATATIATVTASLAGGFTMDADNDFDWELVYAGSGEPVPEAAATVTPSGNNASSAEVRIVNRALLASGRLRLNVAAARAMPNYVLINVATPQIQIGGVLDLGPITIRLDEEATGTPIVASLPSGEEANFHWTLVYANNGAPVPTTAATVTTLDDNNSDATVEIVNRALLASERLRLHVTAGGTIANHVLINVVMPEIRINDSEEPVPILIPVDEDATIVTARLSGGELAETANFHWTLVYADGGAAVPTTAARVTTGTPASANNSSAWVEIVDRALLVSEKLLLHVTATGAMANHVEINVEMPDIYINNSEEPVLITIPAGATATEVTARLSGGEPAAANFNWRLVYAYGGAAVPTTAARVRGGTSSNANNRSVQVEIVDRTLLVSGDLRLDVTLGRLEANYVLINVEIPQIIVTPPPSTTIAVGENATQPIVATLPSGVPTTANFNWRLVYANGGAAVPTTAARVRVTPSSANNSSARVEIVNRALLVSGALRLDVTLGRLEANYVLINVEGQIHIGGALAPGLIPIPAGENATQPIVASLPSGAPATANFNWTLVYANNGLAVPTEAARVTVSGANNSSARVEIVDRALLASGALRLNVTLGGAVANHVLINVAGQIHIGGVFNPAQITIAPTDYTTQVAASLSTGALATATNFNWTLVYANNGAVVLPGAATVTSSGDNNRDAEVRIVNRALLVSGELRLNVTLGGAIANHVLIDVVIPQIHIGNRYDPPSITIAPGATNEAVSASFPLPTGATANFNWTLVYANGLAVPTGAATVDAPPPNAAAGNLVTSNATVTIVNRALLVSGALRLNVTAGGAIANHVLITVQMPQIYIGNQLSPPDIPILVGVDETAPIVASLSAGALATATNFNWTLVYASNGVAVPPGAATVTVTPSSANNSSARLEIVNRALLTSGALRLNVTLGSVMANHVLIDVTILPCALSALEWCRAHDTFKDPQTQTVWRVLLPDDGDGHALIITEHVHMLGSSYHSDIGFTPFQSADAISNVRQWWADANASVIGPILRARAVDYEFQNASGDSIPRTSTDVGAGIEVNRVDGSGNSAAGAVFVSANVPRGRTRANPGSNLAVEPFILSTSEVNHYFSGATGPQGRQARRVGGAEHVIWWLRSPGFMTTASENRHAAVLNNGFVGAGSASANWVNVGHRPALWITNGFGPRSNR